MKKLVVAGLFLVIAGPVQPHEVSPGLGERLLPADQRWRLFDNTPTDARQFLLPEQLPELAALPADRQQRLRGLIREHELSVRFVRKAIKATRGAVRGGHMHAKPEYRSALSEIVIGVDRGLAAGGDPLHAHEPVLRALPAYTRIEVLTPARFVPEVNLALRRLGLDSRTRVVANPKPPEDHGATRWVRDTFLLAEEGRRQTLFHSLGYQPRRDVYADELGYLEFLRTSRRKVVTVPLFYRAGNFLLGVKDGRSILFAGADEIAGNNDVYRQVIGRVPPVDAVLEVFAAITGADEVQTLPNTRRLFHIDMYLSFLDDGVVALLDPLDPGHLSAEDRDVLQRARAVLGKRGFRIVPVPTVAERIARFQSSTNIVPYRHRETGERQALVPDFPDLTVRINGRDQSLNALVDQAFRGAGVRPVFVEDRFYRNQGNTHCALVALK